MICFSPNTIHKCTNVCPSPKHAEETDLTLWTVALTGSNILFRGPRLQTAVGLDRGLHQFSANSYVREANKYKASSVHLLRSTKPPPPHTDTHKHTHIPLAFIFHNFFSSTMALRQYLQNRNRVTMSESSIVHGFLAKNIFGRLSQNVVSFESDELNADDRDAKAAAVTVHIERRQKGRKE